MSSGSREKFRINLDNLNQIHCIFAIKHEMTVIYFFLLFLLFFQPFFLFAPRRHHNLRNNIPRSHKLCTANWFGSMLEMMQITTQHFFFSILFLFLFRIFVCLIDWLSLVPLRDWFHSISSVSCSIVPIVCTMCVCA